MAAPSVARPRGRPRFSGLAWRRARWGYVFIAPWIIGFVLFTAFPMIATLVFTFTNINLAQAEPLRFVGLKNYADAARRPAGLGVARRSPSSSPPWPCRSRSSCRSLVALMLHSRHLRGSGAFRVLFFLPYVVPFVAGVLIWRRHAQPRHAAGSTGSSRSIGIAHPPDWLRTRPGSTPGLVIMGVWGDRGRDHRLPGRPQGHPDRPLRGGPDRRRGRLGSRSGTSRSR